MKRQEGLELVEAVLYVLLIALIVLCVYVVIKSTSPWVEADTTSNYQHRFITVSGMPCLVVKEHFSGKLGVTCDWSKYDGLILRQ